MASPAAFTATPPIIPPTRPPTIPIAVPTPGAIAVPVAAHILVASNDAPSVPPPAAAIDPISDSIFFVY